ncbi:Non-reducing polyketide synthase nscA [Colletotrichum trifolii]|uniref:Non-reducing polyketide synthase nscA n=1 Tax=Colletotrichum trifolii TaxID=5466 RepID=A0A4R8REX0_COLTR|nr:Non-reducing polyketide synthase nscA [Colletotrichum trifolii]
MLSVRAGIETINSAMSGDSSARFELSCVNGPKGNVVSGERADMDRVKSRLESISLKCMVLDIPYAFHAAQLDFAAVLQAAREMGIVDEKTIWVEVGPHPICSSFIGNSLSSDARAVASLRRGEDAFTTLSGSLAVLRSQGVPGEWNECFKPFDRDHELLNLPAYRRNKKNYWIQCEGTWTLDKAYPPGQKPSRDSDFVLPATTVSSLRTAFAHHVTSEEVVDIQKASLTALSDIQHPSLLDTIRGHTIASHSVATSVPWAYMALTVDEHLYRLLNPDSPGDIPMNVSDMEVLYAQVTNEDSRKPQLIQIRAEANMAERRAVMRLHNEAFASATIRYEDATNWKGEWNRVVHLVTGRIADLARRAASGEEPAANRLSRGMACELFRNVVDYTEEYCGMRSVVLFGHEGARYWTCLIDCPLAPKNEAPKPATVTTTAPAQAVAPAESSSASPEDYAVSQIARENGLELSKLADDAPFVELGVDLLMLLVLLEKFRTDLQLEVKSSLFLECQNIGELKIWLADFVREHT